MLLEHELERVGAVLGESGIRWAPFKGMDLASRVYAYPEERPAADLDIVIDTSDYRPARRALENAGWRSVFPGARAEEWIDDEGYSWEAIRPGGSPVLEVHIRLWPLLPPSSIGDLMAAITPDADLGPSGHRIPLAHAFVLAAVHGWLNPPPRPLLHWWDLALISRHSAADFVDQVASLARRWDIGLLVAMAAAQTECLWPQPQSEAITVQIMDDLRAPERFVARRIALQGTDAHWRSLSIARLLANRRQRMAWTGVWRYFWSHPGVVERETPAEWPPTIRRLYHLSSRLGCNRVARWIRDRQEMASD